MINKVYSGDKFHFAAADYNQMADTVNTAACSGGDDFRPAGKTLPATAALPAGRTFAYCAEAAEVGRAVVPVSLNNSAGTSDWLYRGATLTVSADLSERAPGGVFGVVVEPIPAGGVGVVAFAGAVAAHFPDGVSGKKRATPTADNAFTASDSGEVPIIADNGSWGILQLPGGAILNAEGGSVYTIDRTNPADDGKEWDPFTDSENPKPADFADYDTVCLRLGTIRPGGDSGGVPIIQVVPQDLIWSAVNAPVIRAVTAKGGGTPRDIREPWETEEFVCEEESGA